MDSVSTYSYISLAWLATQGIPLVLWPSFISSLLGEEYHESNPLEHYYARSLGVALIVLGLMTVVLTGSIPLTTAPDEDDTVSPYATATLFLTTAQHSSATTYAYLRYNATSLTAFAVGAAASGVLATVGLLTLLFAGDPTRRSKKSGYDKNTSSFPFKNKEAYRAKKREEKRGLKEY